MPNVLLSRRAYFSCGIRLGNPQWDAPRNHRTYGRDLLPHGHDYVLDVAYGGEISSEDGMIVNIVEIKPLIAAALVPLDGCFLQQGVAPLGDRPPTLEHILQYLWESLPPVAGAGRMERLRLRESRVSAAELNHSFMTITRSYEFAAAHRLFAPGLSNADNWNRYDKCSNPAGHGHNYIVEVSVAGAPDPETGYVVPPALLDRVVDEEVFARFDHKHLNTDCPEFANLVPTSENLARIVFEVLATRLKTEGYELARVGLHETQKNYFEVTA